MGMKSLKRRTVSYLKFFFANFDLVFTLVINILQNAFVSYMRLFHFKEAYKCAKYLINMEPSLLRGYILTG